MNAKNIFLTLLAAAIISVAPAAAMAGGHGHPERCPQPHRMSPCERPAMPCLNPEQIAQMKQFRKEHRAALAPLREQISQKRMELHALAPNPNVKPDDLKGIVNDIMSLRKQIRTVNDSFRDKMEKAGLPFWGDCGPRGPHGRMKNCGPRAGHDGHTGPGWRGDCGARGPHGGHLGQSDCAPHSMSGICPVSR